MESRGCQPVRLHEEFKIRLCYIVKPCQPKKNGRKRLDTTMVYFSVFNPNHENWLAGKSCHIKMDIGWVDFVRKIWVLFLDTVHFMEKNPSSLNFFSLPEGPLLSSWRIQVTVVICINNEGESQASLKEYHHVCYFWKQSQYTGLWGCGFILG